MDDHDRSHWDIFAECTDLTIEGHRLIAQEIAYEATLMWRGFRAWLGDLAAAALRWRSAPPV